MVVLHSRANKEGVQLIRGVGLHRDGPLDVEARVVLPAHLQVAHGAGRLGSSCKRGLHYKRTFPNSRVTNLNAGARGAHGFNKSLISTDIVHRAALTDGHCIAETKMPVIGLTQNQTRLCSGVMFPPMAARS